MAIYETEQTREPYATGMGDGPHTDTAGSIRSPSTIALVRELLSEVSALTRTEIELATTEAKQSLKTVQHAATAMATGGAILHAGMLALVACAVFALDRIWPTWLAAGVVGAVCAAIGMIVINGAKRQMKSQSLMPDHTMKTLRETQDFMRRERARATEKWQ